MKAFFAALSFAVTHYAFLVALAGCSFLVGHALLRRIPFASAWERASLSAALGLGILSHILFLLGTLKVLSRPAVVVAVVAWLVAFHRDQFRFLARAVAASPGRIARIAGLVLLGALIAAPVLCLPLYPPHDWDATELYLASARIYVEQHALVVTPYLRFEVYPQLCQLLFALGLMFVDDVAAQLTHFLMFVITAAALVAMGRREFSARTGWWAAALFVGNPMVVWLGSTAYLDLGVALFITVAVYALAVWLEEQDRRWLLLCAGFCGFAASTKYTALPVIAMIGAVVVVASIRSKRWWSPAIFSAVVIAVGAPSYLRNFIYSGNPLFPLLPEVFGYGSFNAEDVRAVLEDLRDHYGIGRSIRALLTIPWQLTFHPESFHGEAALSPVYLFVLPVLIVLAVRRPKIRFYLGAVIVLTVYWFFNAQILRHLVPVLPLLSLVSAAGLDWLFQRSRLPTRWAESRWATVVLGMLLTFPGWRHAQLQSRRNGPVPVTVDQRDKFLAWTHLSYPAYQLLNRERGRDYSLYALVDTDMAYFAHGLFMGDWFGPARYARILDVVGTGAALRRELGALGAEFFLVNRVNRFVDLPDDEAWRSYFLPVYARDGIFLFRVLPQPVHELVGDNALRNSGFDQLADGRPVAWELDGSSTVERSDGGEVVVHASTGINCPHQRVPVRTGALYRIGFRARATRSEQKARFQANYLRADGGPVAVDASLIPVAEDWKSYETLTIVPEGAASAEIYACTGARDSILFDDVWLREVTYAEQPNRFR